MAAWFLPALKAVLPHVGTIISSAAPVFTKKSDATVANQTLLLQQQVTELQAAASQNAAHVRELAEQLQSTVCRARWRHSSRARRLPRSACAERSFFALPQSASRRSRWSSRFCPTSDAEHERGARSGRILAPLARQRRRR